MNRNYTKESYLALAKKIKQEIPDISLTTDIIVGFPGETKEDFEETMDVVREIGYDSAFTFIYSKRTGTPAAKFENPISAEEINENFNCLLKEIQSTSTKKALQLQGTVQKVLVEEQNSHDQNLVTGRLENNSVVHFKGDIGLIGTIVSVRLIECKGFYYLGELCKK